MKFNNKRLEKTSIIINYTIAVLLCGFLILLSSIFIEDVDKWGDEPSVEQFQNHDLWNEKNAEIQAVLRQISPMKEKENNVQQTIKTAEKNHRNAKKSFDNWLKARKTIGSPSEDLEVLKRANELDSYFKTQQEWEKELFQINDSLTLLINDKKVLERHIFLDNKRAEEEYLEAIRAHDFNVFLIRLLIILPLLIIGVFFIFRFRNHKYWPLFLGFVLFSLYAFFFGLVPYLPDYGGYIRYSVGIILIILLGVYSINKIRKFVEQKKSELKVSTEVRAKKVLVETAENALEKHMCPSCGKDFIVRGWDKSLKKNNKTQTFGMVTDFCRFCGLELFKKCNSCGTENFAHLPYCCSCGDDITAKDENIEHVPEK